MGWCIYLEFLEAAAEIVKSHLFLHFFFKFHKEYIHQGKCPMSLIRFDVLGMLQISQKSVFLFAWILVRFMSEWDMLFVRCFLVGSDLQLLLRGIVKNLKWGVQTLDLNYGVLTFDSHRKLRINLWNIVDVFFRFSLIDGCICTTLHTLLTTTLFFISSSLRW